MSASAVAVMALHDSSAKMQPHTIQRLLRASSTGNTANLAIMGASHALPSTSAAALSPISATTPSAIHTPSSASSTLSSSSPVSPAVTSSSASSSTASSPSSASRPVSLRSRFSPGHIRISIASRHAELHDSAARIKEEEDEREERKNNDDERGDNDEAHYSTPARPINHSSHTSASSSSSVSSVSGLPAARSRLHLSQLRPSIHTARRDAQRKSSLLSASPAITPSSTSPHSSFLPTTRPHAHSLSFTTNRLSQHPEDAHHTASNTPSASSSALHSRRNSLSRYTPIGNEEQRGRDVDDGGVFSARSPHLFSPTSAASPSLPSAAAARPTNAGSWRHRRPQCLTAPFSSNAINATTVTASALSSVGSSAQLSSAHSVSPSVHTVTFPSATSSASHTPTPWSSTSSPPSASASFTSSITHSSASRIASPLMTSLSPSLISALIHVNDPSHHSHSHTAHAHSTLPAAETIEEETPTTMSTQPTRSNRSKEEKRDRHRKQQKPHKAENRVMKRKEERTQESKETEVEERKEEVAVPSTLLPVPQRTVSQPTPVTHESIPRSPPTPQFVPPLPTPPLRPVSAASSPAPSPPAAAAAPVAHFGPLFLADELSGANHPPIRVAMRGRSAGSIMLVAAGGECATDDRVDEAVNGRGRGGSVPVNHTKDWASLTAIQHLSAVTVKLSNQG